MKVPIKQRVGDLYGFLGRHRLTLKQVCDRAGLNYDSVKSNLSKHSVSEERIDALENAACDIVDEQESELSQVGT